jgi:two-component system sensor histidine kinase KdpD
MDDRPDPDTLLERLSKRNSDRGRLKLFLGYVAGVGKTFSMLQAAHSAKSSGSDLIAGWVEPHARAETTALLQGLEILSPLKVTYHSMELADFDLDACLSRHPEIVLIDELAHTNAPGLRHEKRWQDVEELLGQGIEVWTTLNVQHLDSMNDIVARITGIFVRETVPDAMFDKADEVEIVDVAPEDLLERLRQGKIYSMEQAERALSTFFQHNNLLALREITLRRAADRVARDVDSARSQANVEAVWPVRERLMVSVSPSPTSEDLLRAAARMAARWGADLLAVYIETPGRGVLDTRAKDQLDHNLAIAENLGAETVILQGEEVARDLVAYARMRNVTKIVLGKNRDPGWIRIFKRTIGDELLRISGEIDLYVITGRDNVKSHPTRSHPTAFSWRSLVWTVLLCAGFTSLAIFFKGLGMVDANVVLTLLLGVVVVAGIFGLFASVFASALMVLTFNYFFTRPYYSLSVDDPQYYLVFLFLLIVGTVIGALTERLKVQTKASRSREQRMEALYRLSRDLSHSVDQFEVVKVAEGMLSQLFGLRVRVLVPQNGLWEVSVEGVPQLFTTKDIALFNWVLENSKKAGWTTSTLSQSDKLVCPLEGTSRILGVLVLEKDQQTENLNAESVILLEALSRTISISLERVTLVLENQKNALAVEAEKTRNSLLHGLSHDLRTPLTVIIGTISNLEVTARLDAGERAALETIGHESRWLARQVDNLLDLTRLSDSVLQPQKDWIPAEDLAYSSLARLHELHPETLVELRLPATLPLIFVDALLLQRAVLNLLENAVVYAGQGPIELALECGATEVKFLVRDRGPGVPDSEKGQIFQKFVRGSSVQSLAGRHGTGLGLAIVAAAVELHQGQLGVKDRPGGGAEFWFSLPLSTEPPSTLPETGGSV